MKIGVVSLGCPKNLVDSETMLGLIHEDNFEITNDPAEAEIIIVNTCGFIESAKEESINTILQMAEYKNPAAAAILLLPAASASVMPMSFLTSCPKLTLLPALRFMTKSAAL